MTSAGPPSPVHDPLRTRAGAVAPRLRVVVLGAGFAGLACVKALAHAPVDIVLLDRQNHHCFQPLLYQVATAALAPNQVAWPIRGVLRDQANVTVLMAEVEGVDLHARRVRAGGREIAYDRLVVATGATHAYFGHDEWAAFAPGLKRIEDATAIRRQILSAFELAELAEDAAERERLTTFVIVGGGPTGVELAGAIAEVAKQALPHEFRRIDPSAARVLLVEAGPKLLPVYPDALSDYAARALRRKGVEVRTGAPVTAVDDHGVEIEGVRLPAATVLWAAGVAASPAAAWLGAEADRSGRVKVAADLSLPGRPEVLVIGDVAALPEPVPGIAPAAKQMGEHAARTIAAAARGRAGPGAFRYRHAGDLATIGRNAAVVKLGRLQLKGFVAWVFWSLAHVYFLIGARNRIAVAFNWLWDYITFQRGARLIMLPASGRGPPPSP